MDLVIAGATIKDETMIQKAIASVPDYPFSKKYILFDGLKEDSGSLKTDNYFAYTKYIANKYPEFIVIRFDECIYFRDMIEYVCGISEADRLFVIQDDVEVKPMDLKQIEVQMNELKDLKILSFPHKYIPPEGTHWYEVIDDSWPLPFIKCHGWSERVFICDRLRMLDITTESYTPCLKVQKKSTWRTNFFIEFIYHKVLTSAEWRDTTEEKKEQYWNMVGCYFHHDIYHKHLVAKR
jgi:hypothetical protein